MRPKTHKQEIKKAVKNLMEDGVYEPSELFDTLYEKYPSADYRVIREAIHEVKSFV
jgi:hypothetical protein